MQFCKFNFIPTLILGILLVSPIVAVAQETSQNRTTATAGAAGQPVALVSITNIERLMGDITYLLRAANVPEYGGLVSIVGNQYTQGLDRNRPIGVSIQFEGSQPVPTAFIPISNRQTFFEGLGAIGVVPEDIGGGVFEIAASGNRIYVKDQGGWLHVAQAEANLSKVVADPSTMLGDLPKKYDVAIKMNVQALPNEIREFIMAQIKAGFDRQLSEQRGQSDDEKKTAREMGEASLKQIEETLRDTEQLMAGFNIDQSNQLVLLDGAAQFLPNTKYAKQSEDAANVTSLFNDFAIPNSAIRGRISSVIPASEKAMSINNIRNSVKQLENRILKGQEVPNEESRAALAKLVRGIGKLVEQTIEEGKFDGGMGVSVANNELRVLVGGIVADGQGLAQELKDAAATFKTNPNAPKIAFDYGTHGGMSLHRLTVPLRISNPKASKVFGDTLHVLIATGPKAFVVNVDPLGEDATIKSAIDRLKPSKATPTESMIEVGQLLKFANEVDSNPVIEMALNALAQLPGKDHIQVQASLIPRGMMYRLSIEEAVMRAIGSAAKAGQQGGGF